MGISPETRTALENAYRKYADTLYRIALSHTGHRQDAEDAVHDVFLRFVEKAPVFADQKHEEAWFIRVTINRCLDLLRRNKRRGTLALDENIDRPAEPDEPEESETLEAVRRLPPKYKDVILLHCLEEKSVEATAEILGISVSAVKMRLMRGREMLKKG